jgi:hypothetical protein
MVERRYEPNARRASGGDFRRQSSSNQPTDGDKHEHVIQSSSPAAQTNCHYVRDVGGDGFVDDSQ